MQRIVLYCLSAWLISRILYCFVLKEKDLTSSRKAKVREEMKDMEASLRRAKLEASLADGISWGMDEDAIEENEVWFLYYRILEAVLTCRCFFI